MISKNVIDPMIALINEKTDAARKILRHPNYQIMDKDTETLRPATEHEQLEAARRILGQGYTGLQKLIVEQYEGGQLGKKNRRRAAVTQVAETAANMEPEQVVAELTADEPVAEQSEEHPFEQLAEERVIENFGDDAEDMNGPDDFAAQCALANEAADATE